MSLIKPSGYNIPATVTTLERQITHDILVASRIYRNEKILEDDGVLRDVVNYFLFTSGSGELRFGFRGSWELNPAYTAANTENKDFWEYILEHAVVSLPTAYYTAS